MSGQHFRAGVVVVVRHPDGRVLALERADSPGSWQLPQGGIDGDEEPIEAAWRELGEETGLGEAAAAARAEFPEWVAYEWPEEVRAADRARREAEGPRRRPVRRGQVQRWFLFDAASADVEPVPDGDEFVAWQWVQPGWLIDHVPEWRQPAYRRVLGTL